MKIKTEKAKKIIKRLDDQKSDREKITLYLSRKLYLQLQKSCDEYSPSQIIEELIREYLGLKE